MATVSPFAPGRSPFHIKGVAYRGVSTYLDAKVPGGFQALLDSIADVQLREFLKQPFLSASLYDVFPLAQVKDHAAKLLGISDFDYQRQTSQVQADADLGGIYKVILRVFNPPALMERIGRLTAQYFDFATETHIERLQNQEATLTRLGFLKPLVEWYEPTTVGYFETALARTGAKDVKVKVSATDTGQQAQGVPMVNVTAHVTWR
jgi:hypothetical protein